MDFANTEIAFRHYSDQALRTAYGLFQAMKSPRLVNLGSKVLEFALKVNLPVAPIVKLTLFRQFCGGESLEECAQLSKVLDSFKVGSIVDYSVEGKNDEVSFELTCDEILRTIEFSATALPPAFAVFKMSGMGRIALLEKVQQRQPLTVDETRELDRIRDRTRRLCASAARLGVRLMVDAEDYCFQDAADEIVLEMMRQFNKKGAVVYNTLQMYRHDRLAYLKAIHKLAIDEGFFLGLKIVRGAYMEKERARAEAGLYSDPIYPDKESTDQAFDECLNYCVTHIDRIWILAGTHNEKSTRLLVDHLTSRGISRNDQRVVFSQLLGMSDNLSFNLAHHGYLVKKYVPYGPIRDVVPYLIRRAEENTSIQGQTGRELTLLAREITRRRKRS